VSFFEDFILRKFLRFMNFWVPKFSILPDKVNFGFGELNKLETDCYSQDDVLDVVWLYYFILSAISSLNSNIYVTLMLVVNCLFFYFYFLTLDIVNETSLN
jgi:hypothetical protein